MRRLLLIALGLAACQTSLQTSETDQAVTSISVTTLDFGTPQVGTTTGYQSGYIRESTHNGSEQISGILYNGSSNPAACPDFTVSATVPGYAELDCQDNSCPQAPGGLVQGFVQCPIIVCTPYDFDFAANFHPTIAADESCAISFQIASGSKNVTLHGVGAPPPIHVGAAPGSVNFGGVRINTDPLGGVGISVSNSGGATATINSVTASAGFSIVAGNTGAHGLGGGGGENFTVICHPTGVGGLNGTFNVSSNDPNTPNIGIALACSGIDSAIAIAPSPAVLPTLRVGETEQKVINITNMGAAATTIQSVTVTGMTMVMAPPAGTALGAGAGTTATIQFDATTKGDVSGSLTVNYDNGKVITTQISAKAVNTSLSLTPDGDIEFGNVCVSQTKSQMFNLIANDEGSFNLTAASAPEDASFAVTPPTFPALVKGSAANQVQFMVSASPLGMGDVTSTIALTTDIPGAEPHVLNLHALGLAAGVNGPPQVDLGGNPINQTSVGQHVEISNCTANPVTVASVTLTGMDSNDFAIVDQPENLTIDPYGSATWLVVLNAHTVGDKAASFDALTSDGTMASVPLVGEGLGVGGGSGSDGGGDTTKSSYYACSAGHASSLWPIGFALGALLLRRRRR